MAYRLFLLSCLVVSVFVPAPEGVAQQTPFEASGGTQTATHAQCIAFYDSLARRFPNQSALLTVGATDVGRPLHLFVLSQSGKFQLEEICELNLPKVLIINAIHPGEPEGVDASMILARNLLSDDRNLALLRKVVVCIVPAYNVDGMLNRGRPSRANQNGPLEYGFRGNAQNLDLNRDCIKLDSRNAQSLARLFQSLDPDLFVDTHTSNGADYQHTLTLIETQPDKLGGPLGPFQRDTLTPGVYDACARQGWPAVPYVVGHHDVPDSGLVAFLETGRYSTGLAALRGIPGYVIETHMLKPFPDRVRSTLAALRACVEVAALHGPLILKRRDEWRDYWMRAKAVPFGWKPLPHTPDSVHFRGYAASRVPGPVTGLPLRHFNRAQPWERNLPYYFRHAPTDSTTLPEAWLLPQAWARVAWRLQLNGVQLLTLPHDTAINVWVEYIEGFQTVAKPYEGHHLHFGTRTRPDTMAMQFWAGDYYIPAKQPLARFIAEVLDPRNPDSYFAWNFFDACLMQKEGFSDYVFEPRLAEILAQDASLANRYRARLAQDTVFAANHGAQLEWLYRQTDYYEPTHNRYPVARIFGSVPTHTLLPASQPWGREPHE